MGYGVVASYGHVPSILRTEGLELAGVFDPSPARISALEKSGAAEIGTTNEEEFWAKEYDAIVVASPVGFHTANARAAIQRGIPVLCEKPLTPTEAESADLIAYAAAQKVPLCVGFVYRYSEVTHQLDEWVRGGEIGDLRSIRIVYLWDLHGEWEQDLAGKWTKSPRWRDRMLEGGPMVDCGVHGIDLARLWARSEIESGMGHGAWVSDYDAPDHMSLHLDHANGVHTSIEMSFTFGHTSRHTPAIFQYHLIGTGGVARYDREGWVTELHNGEGTKRGPEAGEKDFDAMYRAFSNGLHTKDFSALASGQDGLIATKWARDATDNLIKARQARLNLSK